MTYYACTIRYNLHELLIRDVVFIKALHNETRYLSNIQVCPDLKLVTLQKQKKKFILLFLVNNIQKNDVQKYFSHMYTVTPQWTYHICF